jgi:hypothetical protein
MSYEKNQKVVVAVDFDGTLFESGAFPEVGAPIPRIINFVKSLHKAGFVIVIWTLRDEKKGTAKYAKDALELEGVPYDYFNETPLFVQDEWGDQRKLGAHYFIDDRNAGGIPPNYIMMKELGKLAKTDGFSRCVVCGTAVFDHLEACWKCNHVMK